MMYIVAALLWAITAGNGLILLNEQSVLAVIGFSFSLGIASAATLIAVFK